jgi:DNA-directed RNA polymerase subunit K/omega
MSYGRVIKSLLERARELKIATDLPEDNRESRRKYLKVAIREFKKGAKEEKGGV